MDRNDIRPRTSADVDSLLRRLLCIETEPSRAVIDEEIVRLRLAVS